MSNKVTHRLTLFQYGLRSSEGLIRYTKEEGYVMSLPKGWLCYYWVLDGGIVILTSSSLN